MRNTRLAEPPARLVTILGPGGAGKTRLATEHTRKDRAACFVDLSVVDDERLVAAAVLGALGLRETGGGETGPVRRLVAALTADGQALILDNCEHVIDATAALARTLLAECPTLRVVATSREPLGLTGEVLVPLGALPDAVRLFADRAAAVRPGFTVTPDNEGTVADICAALDSLPLAVELAAARLRQFPLDELARRLREHGPFQLLSRGDRTAAARHRTLHALVQWGWELLTPAERQAARRFSVFAGGFAGGAASDAAKAVCETTDDVLADLVDRSMLATDGRRYRMLHTIRLFCADRLAEADEVDEVDPVRRAHARYFLELAREADPHLRRAEQLEWLATLSAEHANLMSALRWAAASDEHEDRETAASMVAALGAYLWLTGRRSEAGEPAAALLAAGLPEEMVEEYVACVAHASPRPAQEHWDRAAKLIATYGRPLRHPFGAALWGMTAGPPADQTPERERQLLGSDPWNAALTRLGRVLLGVIGGRPVDGEPELRAAHAAFSELGERWGTAQTLDWLAQLAGWRGEWPHAHELWAEALANYAELGALEERAETLSRRAECRIRQGDLDAAGADLELAADLVAMAGWPEQPPEIPLLRGTIARLRGDTDAAARLLDQALAAAPHPWQRAEVLTALGRLAEAAGDVAKARERHAEAFATALGSPGAVDLAAAVEGLAGAELLAGQGERVALLLGAAVALRGTAVTGDPDVAAVSTAARDRVGTEEFARAYARGAAMTREQALAAVGTD